MNAKVAEAPKYGKDLKKVPGAFNYPEEPKKSRTAPVHPSCFVIVILPEISQRRQDPRLPESFQIQAFRRANWNPFQPLRTLYCHFENWQV